MKKEILPIDDLTNCIVSMTTGKQFNTEFLKATADDLKAIHKKDGWRFTWKGFKKYPERQIYKLIIANDPKAIIQGLVSIEEKQGFVEVHHAESAPHNFGPGKLYRGVGGNLFAFACKESFRLGLEGFTAFNVKSKLIRHYHETLAAEQISRGSHRMIIYPEAAKKLVNLYFKTYFNEA